MTEARGLKRLALALRRRRTVVLCVGVGTLVAGSLIVAAVPAQYRAEAAVKVIDARPPADYVQPSFVTPAATELVGERMKALRLHILNRPLLLDVAQNTGIADELPAHERKALVDLRERFEFRVEGADTFTIAFTDRDPERAEVVVNRLAKAFMDQENQELEGRAIGTTKLFEDTSRRLRVELDKADLTIGDFKRKH